VPVIDAQHELLFSTAGAFIEAVRSGAAAPEVERLLAFVEDYAAVHFRFEENLMRSTGYPHREAHVREHQHFVGRLRARAADPGPGAARALAELLEGWLAGHVRGSDQRLGEHLRARGSLRG
jgi:methyl-accepting chemotaxis protein